MYTGMGNDMAKAFFGLLIVAALVGAAIVGGIWALVAFVF
ncbi:hypothetical protein [Klebsiella phage vB_Kpn_IME260]|uniref:Uncharacterized protein n=1 Tax=Klebsiella phage vB_Kpn_IME260 TaxID=1912318 RepID=A0A1L6Z505_9CAUD|nr:hypothetical protein FDH16_gp028 [Klebsiella phage vB_Kpn_IME260]APT41074.1 hypothetical protein [Klebsiella phage vB_Kpn_IME260]